MKFRAYVDQVKWADQLKKLAEATGLSLRDAIKQQAGLVCIDAMKMTPPFPSTRGVKGGANALKTPFTQHRKAGERAIMRDIKRVYKPASMWPDMTTGSDKAKQIAKYARKGNITAIHGITSHGYVKRISKIEKKATLEFMKAQRTRSGRVSPGYGALLHTGRIPDFQKRETDVLESYGGLKRIYNALRKRLGIAKSGWVKAADSLGVGKRVPNWIRRHGTGNGIYRLQRGKVDWAVIMGNATPFIQEKGRDLRIVELALEGRQRLIEKQIAATLRKRKVVQ